MCTQYMHTRDWLLKKTNSSVSVLLVWNYEQLSRDNRGTPMSMYTVLTGLDRFTHGGSLICILIISHTHTHETLGGLRLRLRLTAMRREERGKKSGGSNSMYAQWWLGVEQQWGESKCQQLLWDKQSELTIFLVSQRATQILSFSMFTSSGWLSGETPHVL